MHRYSLRYFLGQGFRGFWRNGVMSLASIFVLVSCLIVIGSFGLLVYNINLNMDMMNGLNEIVAFVEPVATYESGDNLRLPSAVTPVDTRLSFLGWSTDPDAETPEYAPDAVYTAKNADAVGDCITFYAIWNNSPSLSGVRVLYNANGNELGGALPTDDKLYQIGDAIRLPETLEPRYVNISFYGWCLDPDPKVNQVPETGTEGEENAAGSEIYRPGDLFPVTEDAVKGGKITLYAVWSEKPTSSAYGIVYDMNGVDVLPENRPTAEGVRLQNIRAQIEAMGNIDTVTLVTKEQAFSEELEHLKEYPDLIASLEGAENFYPDAFHITYLENASIETLEYRLSGIEGVYKVNCRADIAETIETFKKDVILIFVWFMIVLFLISIFIILNTVKLSVYERRDEISIMCYVGATRTFIAMPFVIEGTIIGLISAAAAYFLQQLLYGRVQKILLTDFNLFSVVGFDQVWKYILFGFLAIGVFCGVVGSSFSLRKHMKM